MPDPMSTRWVRHDPNKVYTNEIEIESIFGYIEHDRPLEGSSFWESKSIKRMSMGIIGTVFYFDEYRDILASHDDIDLTSLDLIITIDGLISLGLEIVYRDIFSGISDASSRRWQGEKVMKWEDTYLWFRNVVEESLLSAIMRKKVSNS
jgi:hypothetical protein